jgi:hypothetical protein
MCTGPDRSRRVCLCSMSMFISADPLIKLILVAVAHTLPCEMVRPCPLSSSSVCLHGWVDGACVFCVIVVSAVIVIRLLAWLGGWGLCVLCDSRVRCHRHPFACMAGWMGLVCSV